MLRKAALSAAVGAMAMVAIGCALTDYRGIPNHQTQSEAKMWGKEIAFTGFASDLDGTYTYTGKYAPGSPVTLNSYLNPNRVSFSRDGLVDRDGDDIQGRSGDAGGKFNKQFVAVDRTPGFPCEFFANITFDKSSTGAPTALCNDSFNEEIDKDFELQDAFASLGDLFAQIWSGALATHFTVQLTSVQVNGSTVPLTNAVSMNITHNGLRPINMAVDLSSPGGQELIRALLANTPDRQPVRLGVGFGGGMAFSIPASVTVAFNHASLEKALK